MATNIVTALVEPTDTATKDLREMEAKDLDAIHDLFTKYMEKFDLVPKFAVEEVEHWLLNEGSKYGERIVWTDRFGIAIISPKAWKAAVCMHSYPSLGIILSFLPQLIT